MNPTLMLGFWLSVNQQALGCQEPQRTFKDLCTRNSWNDGEVYCSKRCWSAIQKWNNGRCEKLRSENLLIIYLVIELTQTDYKHKSQTCVSYISYHKMLDFDEAMDTAPQLYYDVDRLKWVLIFISHASIFYWKYNWL